MTSGFLFQLGSFASGMVAYQWIITETQRPFPGATRQSFKSPLRERDEWSCGSVEMLKQEIKAK